MGIDGDTMVIGAPRDGHTNIPDAGSVYVFTKDSNGAWNQAAKLTASDADRYDRFGESVGIDDDTIVVGAHYDDHSDRGNAGSVYVFVKPSGGWDDATETAKLVASDADTNDWFGGSVGIDGDTIVVGARRDHTGASFSGSVYVFVKPSGGWDQWDSDTDTETAKLVASDAATSDWFGWSVGIDADTIVVGAFYDDHGDRSDAGSVYVFVKPSGGWDQWDSGTDTETAKLTASDAAANDRFGYSVGVDSDTIVVGAVYDDDGGLRSGSVYVFVKPDGGWDNATETAKLVASDAAAGDQFGWSVGIDADRVVVGAFYDDDGGLRSGSVYVFAEDSDGVWSEAAKLTAFDAAAYDDFGWSVGVDGDTIVVGARGDDHDNLGAGSVYVVDVSSGWAEITGSTYETTSYTVTGLTNDTVYVFWVRAGNNSSEYGRASDPAHAVAALAPGAPTGLSVSAGDREVTLSWTDPDDLSITGYQYSADGGETFMDIAGSNADTVRYTVGGLVSSTEYTLAVRAVNDTGDGAAASVTVRVLPARPVNLTAVGGDTQVTLSWDNPQDSSITGYQLWRQPEPANLVASDATNGDWFGHSVAVDDDTIVIGAPWDDDDGANSGSVYVFTKDSNGAWNQAAKLTASDAAAGDRFGWSVGVAGDTIVVGAHYDDHSERGDAGSVYVFIKPDGGWGQWDSRNDTEAAKLVASDPAASDGFGDSVGIDGDTVVVGASGDDDGGSSSGSVYVFVEPTDGWHQWDSGTDTEAAKLVASDPAASDWFGHSVAVDGDTVVVGALGDDHSSRFEAGSVYVFVEPTDGWDDDTETTKLTASDAATYDRFGGSVGIDGDTIVVGAPNDDDGGSSSGSVYVFVKPTDGWDDDDTETAKLTASDAAGGDRFGESVGIDGDTVVIGAREDGHNFTVGAGSVYVFVKPDGGWADDGTETTKLTASDAAVGDRFGESVGTDGDTMVVGAPYGDYGANRAGSVYVVDVSSGEFGVEWSDLADSVIGGSDADARSYTITGLTNYRLYGFRVRAVNESGAGRLSISASAVPATAPAKPVGLSAVAGDREVTLSWDDPDDVSINKYQYSTDGGTGFNDMTNSAAATTVFTVGGLDSSAQYTLGVRAVNDTGSSDASLVTVRVLAAQPTGVNAVGGDALVTLSWADPGDSYITGYELWQQVKLVGLVATDVTVQDFYGGSVAVDGDMVVVGAPYDDSGSGSGSVYVFIKDSNGVWTETAKLVASDAGADARFGVSVGIDDDTVVVGAYRDDHNNVSGSGSVYVFVKDSNGVWTETAKLVAFDAGAYDSFGYSVAIDDDTVVVGAYRDDDSVANSGSVYVFVEPAGGWDDATETAKLVASDAGAYDYLGYSVGIDDDTVVVGAYRDDDSVANSGSVYVFVEPAGGWDDATETAKLVASDAGAYDYFGWSVGIDDDTVVIGAPYDDDNSASGSGSVYAFVKDSEGVWNEAAKLLASDAAGEDFFGWSVGIDDDTVVIGASYNDDNYHTDTGSVYVFVEPDGGWDNATETAKLTSSDATAYDSFGWSVGIDGDTVVVGAPQDINSVTGSGLVYVLDISSRGFGAGWTTIADSTAATTAHTITNVTNYTTYDFGVRAVNESGPSLASLTDSATPATIPAAPVGLSAVAGDSEMTLSWDDPVDPSISGYQYNINGNTEFNDMTDSTAATASYVVTGLAPSTEYTFGVRAVNDTGTSEVATVTKRVLPAQPVGFAVTAGNTQVTLSWTNPSDTHITAYQYQQAQTGNGFDENWTTIPNSTAATTSYTITGLTNDTSYVFRIRAVNESGGSPASATGSTTPLARAPAQPTGLSAMPGDREMILSWTDPSDVSITKYEYSTDNETSYTDIPGSDAATTSYTVTGLTPSGSYTFGVRAVNDTGTGTGTTIVKRVLPAQPVGLSATGGNTQVTLSWDDPGRFVDHRLSVSAGHYRHCLRRHLDFCS